MASWTKYEMKLRNMVKHFHQTTPSSTNVSFSCLIKKTNNRSDELIAQSYYQYCGRMSFSRNSPQRITLCITYNDNIVITQQHLRQKAIRRQKVHQASPNLVIMTTTTDVYQPGSVTNGHPIQQFNIAPSV